MENNQQQILSEIKSLMASVRLQLDELDAKISQWQQCVEPGEIIDMSSVMDFNLEGGMYSSFDEPVQIVEETTHHVEEIAPVVEEVLPVVEEVSCDDLPLEEDDDLPFFDVPELTVAVEEPVVVEEVAQTRVEAIMPASMLNDVHASTEKSAVIDVMTQHHAWRSAMPGSPVKDVRGAIALMDRVLFINTLFGTDPMAFQETLTQINQMQTLDQAVEYLAAAHPEWDFDSDVVYSFMMAVRRKVNA